MITTFPFLPLCHWIKKFSPFKLICYKIFSPKQKSRISFRINVDVKYLFDVHQNKKSIHGKIRGTFVFSPPF